MSDVLGASYCDILRLAIAPCFSAPDFLFVSCGGLLDFFSLHAFDAQMRYIRYIIFMFYRYSACRIAPVLNSGQFESMLGAYYSYYSNYFVLSTGQGRISGIAAMWTAQAELLRARQAI